METSSGDKAAAVASLAFDCFGGHQTSHGGIKLYLPAIEEKSSWLKSVKVLKFLPCCSGSHASSQVGRLIRAFCSFSRVRLALCRGVCTQDCTGSASFHIKAAQGSPYRFRPKGSGFPLATCSGPIVPAKGPQRRIRPRTRQRPAAPPDKGPRKRRTLSGAIAAPCRGGGGGWGCSSPAWRQGHIQKQGKPRKIFQTECNATFHVRTYAAICEIIYLYLKPLLYRNEKWKNKIYTYVGVKCLCISKHMCKHFFGICLTFVQHMLILCLSFV